LSIAIGAQAGRAAPSRALGRGAFPALNRIVSLDGEAQSAYVSHNTKQNSGKWNKAMDLAIAQRVSGDRVGTATGYGLDRRPVTAIRAGGPELSAASLVKPGERS
jgi:hypothetical protein